MKTYIVDVDNTICLTKDSDYINSQPVQSRIDKINELYNNGHTIIYLTARGSSSGKNWESLTIEQLDKWGCKRHGIKFYKPAYDVWIDDKSVDISFFDE